MEWSSYLPVVNPDVGHSLAREVIARDDEDYLDEHLARLDEENPTISVWIRKFAEQTSDPVGSMFCAVMVYRLLESQAESNKMTEEINFG